MSDIPHLLPPSASHLEVALSRAMARLANVPPFCRQMWDPATCPPSHLPWLAWAVSVDEWDSAWSDAQKRGVIEARFQWAPEGIPYTFGVTGEIGDSGLPPTMYDDIERVALATKNVRSHLAWIRLRATVRGKFYVGGTTIAAEIVSVEPYKLTQIESQGPLFVGAALITYETVEIFPRGPLVLGLVDGAPLALADAAPLALMN